MAANQCPRSFIVSDDFESDAFQTTFAKTPLQIPSPAFTPTKCLASLDSGHALRLNQRMAISLAVSAGFVALEQELFEG
jgi:hypothetical protein